ncbi:Uncharacterised protein [Streptococcus pneumoniae]|nr:hypothetical protein [Streptococcus pneumoniae]VMQ15100.1 Uncharacterised protein [Streptococcus pneumoniae]VMW67223.1 Uncharacterised protein [Streptococcus pneumoniae]VNM74845.1 Uncharacterised protein [Streptococcus pneumoniae]VNZ93308.1 Uncharacterised protein [Streptococcus pneumoniae]
MNPNKDYTPFLQDNFIIFNKDGIIEMRKIPDFGSVVFTSQDGNYDEYHAMVAEVYKLADEQQKTFYEPARKKVMEIVKLGDDSMKEAKYVDSILKKLEKDISKNNEEYKKGKNGYWLSGFYSGLSYEPRDALYGYRYRLNEMAENFKRE